MYLVCGLNDVYVVIYSISLFVILLLVFTYGCANNQNNNQQNQIQDTKQKIVYVCHNLKESKKGEK